MHLHYSLIHREIINTLRDVPFGAHRLYSVLIHSRQSNQYSTQPVSINDLSEHTGLSRRTLYNSEQTLIDIGLISPISCSEGKRYYLIKQDDLDKSKSKNVIYLNGDGTVTDPRAFTETLIYSYSFADILPLLCQLSPATHYLYNRLNLLRPVTSYKTYTFTYKALIEHTRFSRSKIYEYIDVLCDKELIKKHKIQNTNAYQFHLFRQPECHQKISNEYKDIKPVEIAELTALAAD